MLLTIWRKQRSCEAGVAGSRTRASAGFSSPNDVVWLAELMGIEAACGSVTLGECAPLFMMFGFYGALNTWGLAPFLVVCSVSALFIGPTTGRFYGKPLFQCQP